MKFGSWPSTLSLEVYLCQSNTRFPSCQPGSHVILPLPQVVAVFEEGSFAIRIALKRDAVQDDNLKFHPGGVRPIAYTFYVSDSGSRSP